MNFRKHLGAIALTGLSAIFCVSVSGCGGDANIGAPDGGSGTGGATGPAGTGGATASGGSSSSGGTPASTGGGTGGGEVAGTGGTSGGTGGSPPADGGADTNSNDAGAGGAGTGGVVGTGGRVGTGGVVGTGGSTGTGGVVPVGGRMGTGGSAGAAGRAGGAGGAVGTGKITVWLAGDSTMANGSGTCPVGWGKNFQSRFNSNVKVTNSAVGGTTVRSWLYNVTDVIGADGECVLSSPAPQAHWTAMVDGMKAGDYLLIQFGINDTTAATCPKHVGTNTFKQLFGMMAQAAKDKGANPIFLTSVSSIACNGAVARGTRGGFATATKDAATQYNVPVIDLEQLSVALYTASGFCPSTDTAATFSANTPIGNFFCNDHTHFEAAGANQIAGLVAKAIKDQGFGLASDLLP